MRPATRTQRPHNQLSFMKLMLLTNLTYAVAIVASWSTYSSVFADPLVLIAGGAPMAHPSLLEYPYVLMWLMPLSGVAGAYVTHAWEWYSVARLIAAYPILLTAACWAWLYFGAGVTL